MRRLVASLIVLVSAMPGVPGAADPLLSPRKDSIESNVLHQRREIEAHLPEESKQDPAARYEATPSATATTPSGGSTRCCDFRMSRADGATGARHLCCD
jgi:hypothetical protein